MANKDANCTITLKNVPCDLKTFYLQSGHDNDRCLSKEIINVLKRVKEGKEYGIIFDKHLNTRDCLDSEEMKQWRESQGK